MKSVEDVVAVAVERLEFWDHLEGIWKKAELEEMASLCDEDSVFDQIGKMMRNPDDRMLRIEFQRKLGDPPAEALPALESLVAAFLVGRLDALTEKVKENTEAINKALASFK